jgi:kojibiose phosphorylase
MGNAAGGVHAAALGSLWQAVVMGLGGARVAHDAPDALTIEPALVPGIRHLGFPMLFRGRSIEVHVEPAAVEIAVEGAAPVPVRALAEPGPARIVLAEPGRRYAARLGAGGFEEWEEVRSS